MDLNQIKSPLNIHRADWIRRDKLAVGEKIFHKNSYRGTAKGDTRPIRDRGCDLPLVISVPSLIAILMTSDKIPEDQ